MIKTGSGFWAANSYDYIHNQSYIHLLKRLVYFYCFDLLDFMEQASINVYSRFNVMPRSSFSFAFGNVLWFVIDLSLTEFPKNLFLD